jgi:small GTP-binding protein
MMDDEVHTDITIRIILVGDSSTGKTSLLLRYIDSRFNVRNVATVGIDFRTKIMTFGSTVVKVQIFDTAGQERFHTITQAYYRNAAGALIVFDITNQTSFRNIQDPTSETILLFNLILFCISIYYLLFFIYFFALFHIYRFVSFH